jgi:hypothetical protein
MTSRPVPLPDDLPTYFSAAHARRLGLHRQQLNRSQATVVSQGIRQRPVRTPDAWHLAAVLQEIHPTGVFSHHTAAEMWGIWLPWNVSGHDPVHLSKTRADGGSPRRRGVRGHVLPQTAHLRNRRGLRLTSPAWTWVDLAGTAMIDTDLVAAGDSLLQRSDGPAGRREPALHPLSSLAELRAVIGQRNNVRGLQRARWALERLRPGVDSSPESCLRTRLVDAGFPEPAVNPTIRLVNGNALRPDLAWTDLKICIQYEGDHHRTDQTQYRRDTGRDRSMQSNGWIVLRVTGGVFSESGWSSFLADLRGAFASRRRALWIG